MKNSKVLSLLTAGALVVSSFSGLVMNGSVARAAIAGAVYDNTGTTYAVADAAGSTVYIDMDAVATTATTFDVSAGAAAARLYAGSANAAVTEAGTAVATGVSYGGLTFKGTAADPSEITVTGGNTTTNNTIVLSTGSATPMAAATTVYTTVKAFSGLVTTDGSTKADKTETDVPVVGGKTYQINSYLNGAAATWVLGGANPGSFVLSAATGANCTVTLDSDYVKGDTATLTVTLNNITPYVINLRAEGAASPVDRTLDVFTLTESKTGTDITKGTYTMPYTLASDARTVEVKTTIGATSPTGEAAIWGSTASPVPGPAPADPIVTWTVSSLKVNGATQAVGTVGNYVRITPATFAGGYQNSSARFTALSDNEIEMVVKARFVGYASFGGTAYDNSKAVKFDDETSFTLKVTKAIIANGWVNDVEFEDSDPSMQRLTYALYTNGTTAGLSVDDLYYKWELVTADNMVTVNGVQVKKYAQLFTAARGYSDAKNMFELTGGNEKTTKIGMLGSSVGGKYGVMVYVYRNAAEAAADTTPYNAGAIDSDLATINVYDSTLSVSLDSSVISDVVLPDGAKDYENAVTVMRSRNIEVTQTATYKVVNYDEFLTKMNNNGNNVAKAVDAATSASGISISKGKVTVKATAEAGVYVVAAKDGFTNWGVAEEVITIKNKKTVDVTGLELDYNEVILDNLHSTATIYATVLPVSYEANGYTANDAKSATITGITVSCSDENVAYVYPTGGQKLVEGTSHRIGNTQAISIRAIKPGKATVTVTTVDGGFSKTFTLDVRDGIVPEPEPEPEKEHKAGDAFTVDGVSVFVNADGKTLTVTDVTVVGKTATIPATVDGMDVTTIAAQAFKKSDAKTIYVKAAVTDIEKGAFKASKVKKVYFYDPAALKTVGKNAFKKTNAKIVGVEAAFDESVAKDLKKAGAKSVKNNGTAK